MTDIDKFVAGPSMIHHPDPPPDYETLIDKAVANYRAWKWRDPRRGQFITVEGIDGVGKTTQVDRLVKRLEREGIKVIKTREPGGTAGAEQIRQLLIDPDNNWNNHTEVLLFMAARSENYFTNIEPITKRGEWVISDRFVDSTRAYQGYGRGYNLERIDMLYQTVFGPIEPDLTFVLDMPPHQALKRCKSPDRFEQLGLTFYLEIQSGYRKIAADHYHRCALVDADRSEWEVAEDIWHNITGLRKHLAKKIQATSETPSSGE